MTIAGDVTITGTFSATTIISPTSNACCGATSTSDRRLKQDIIQLDNALTKIGKLRGVYFHWNKTFEETVNFSDKRHVGVIAQEVQEVLPEIVQNVTKDYLGVDYAFLTPLLIEGIKELANKTDVIMNMCNFSDPTVNNISSKEKMDNLEEIIAHSQGKLINYLANEVVLLKENNNVLQDEVVLLKENNNVLQDEVVLLKENNNVLQDGMVLLKQQVNELKDMVKLLIQGKQSSVPEN